MVPRTQKWPTALASRCEQFRDPVAGEHRRQALQAPAHPGSGAALWNLALAKRRGRIDAGHVDHRDTGAKFTLERLLPST